MALVRADAMFKIYPAKVVHKQRVALRPNEHHYEKEGEEPYIKYSCQLCEKLSEEVRDVSFEDEAGNDTKFIRFSFAEGTPNCPCCGINIDWSYKTSQ